MVACLEKLDKGSCAVAEEFIFCWFVRMMSGPLAVSKILGRCLELKEKQCLEAPLSPFAMSGLGGNGTKELLLDKSGFN